MIKDLRIPENHPDLDILCRTTHTSKSDLRGAMSPDVEFNYLKVPGVRHWDSRSSAEMVKAFELANQKTSEFRFELVSFDDYEPEEDRIWPAAFKFKSHPKNQ